MFTAHSSSRQQRRHAVLTTARRTCSTGSHIHASTTSTLLSPLSELTTNPQGVHQFKQLSHIEQPHHAQSSTRVLSVTTESSTTTTQQKSCAHKLRDPETLRTCVHQFDYFSVTFHPPHRTRSPLQRVAHRDFDPQCTMPLLASFSERQTAHCIENNGADVPVTVFHQSGNDLDGLLVEVPESQSRSLGQNPRHRRRAYRLQEWLHLLRKVNQLNRKPRLPRVVPPTFNSCIDRSTENIKATEGFITPHQSSARSTIALLPCVDLWMFKCAVVGCAVAKASVVSDADNRRKTCAS